MASRLWIDGIQIDRQVISFGTPHIYDLTRHLTPGKHTITLQLDNRNLLNLDTMSSGYSTDTQGFWNGILGKIQLICEPLFHLENIQVYPDDSGILVKTVQTCDIYSPLERGQAAIELTVTGPDGKSYPMRSFSCELFTSRQVNYFRYDMEDFIPWNEFHPALYTLTVKYTYKDSTDEKQVTFGMRSIVSQGNQLMLNHTPLSLRGTVNCAIYPLTGYPPTDYETWKKHFGILQSYGLNHVRFHTWCPPENAFLAADRLGMYLSVEMPLWLNKDVCTLECGDDPIHRSFFHQEAEAISEPMAIIQVFLCLPMEMKIWAISLFWKISLPRSKHWITAGFIPSLPTLITRYFPAKTIFAPLKQAATRSVSRISTMK
ncbi:MAG: hypothetical protein V8Q57_01785 [Blautia sp.]